MSGFKESPEGEKKTLAGFPSLILTAPVFPFNSGLKGERSGITFD